mmetsp:Transcript_28024/g.32111  ORF Transcript_28024/g.32111 Transcript_28024/m.32111 type:complete len:91 (+) Transcript_28024:299-571(+)
MNWSDQQVEMTEGLFRKVRHAKQSRFGGFRSPHVLHNTIKTRFFSCDRDRQMLNSPIEVCMDKRMPIIEKDNTFSFKLPNKFEEKLLLSL